MEELDTLTLWAVISKINELSSETTNLIEARAYIKVSDAVLDMAEKSFNSRRGSDSDAN